MIPLYSFLTFRTCQILVQFLLVLIFPITMKVYSKHNYRKDEKFRGKRGYKRNRCTVMLNAFRKLSTRLLTEISKLEKFPLLNSSAVDVSFQLLKISPRPGTRAPLSAFVSFAHVHVHTIPVELHPPCPRQAHTRFQNLNLQVHYTRKVPHLGRGTRSRI